MLKWWFLVEDQTMGDFLRGCLSVIAPDLPEASTKITPFRGISDFKNSFHRKLIAQPVDQYKFIILIDKDTQDCIKLKQTVKSTCERYNRPDTLIRIACSEIETWILGDLDALSKTYQKDFSQYKNKAKFRNIDSLSNAKEELEALVQSERLNKGYRQIVREVAPYINPDCNTSHSFQVFVSGLRNKLAEVMAV